MRSGRHQGTASDREYEQVLPCLESHCKANSSTSQHVVRDSGGSKCETLTLAKS